MEMAGMRVSATAFTLSILNSQLHGEYPPNSIYSARQKKRPRAKKNAIFQKLLATLLNVVFAFGLL